MKRPSPRLGYRLTAALLMALIVGDPLAAVLHSAFEEHLWCALHGHIVHAHGESAATSDDRAVASEDGLRVAAADGCPAVLAFRQGSLTGAIPATDPTGLLSPMLAPAGAPGATRDLLSLAPKQGPPADPA